MHLSIQTEHLEHLQGTHVVPRFVLIFLIVFFAQVLALKSPGMTITLHSPPRTCLFHARFAHTTPTTETPNTYMAELEFNVDTRACLCRCTQIQTINKMHQAQLTR